MLKAVQAKLAEVEVAITVLNDKIIIQLFQSFIVAPASQPIATTASIVTAAETPGQLQITFSWCNISYALLFIFMLIQTKYPPISRDTISVMASLLTFPGSLPSPNLTPPSRFLTNSSANPTNDYSACVYN